MAKGRGADRIEGLQYIRTAMTDGLLAEKPDLGETWMRGAMLNRLGVVSDHLRSPR